MSSPSIHIVEEKVDGSAKMAGMRCIVTFCAKRSERTYIHPEVTLDWPNVQASPEKVPTRVLAEYVTWTGELE